MKGSVADLMCFSSPLGLQNVAVLVLVACYLLIPGWLVLMLASHGESMQVCMYTMNGGMKEGMVGGMVGGVNGGRDGWMGGEYPSTTYQLSCTVQIHHIPSPYSSVSLFLPSLPPAPLPSIYKELTVTTATTVMLAGASVLSV